MVNEDAATDLGSGVDFDASERSDAATELAIPDSKTALPASSAQRDRAQK
jgi:hypothetical protein